MKINDMNRVGAVNPYRKDNSPSHTDKTSTKGKAKDEVHISEEAKLLLGTQEVGPARAARMNELKNEVSTGTYHVDADKIAEKLWSYFSIK